MGTNNSSVSFYETLYIRLYDDIAERLRIRTRTQNYERALIHTRITQEGISFLTKSLPMLGKAVDTALAHGETLSVKGFKTPKDDKRPRFLGWLFGVLFTNEGTEVVDHPVVELTGTYCEASLKANLSQCEALAYIRQLAYFVYKLKIPYEPAQTEKVLAEFIRTDEELQNYPIYSDSDYVIKLARRYTSDIFSSMDEMDIIPNHGPGSVATGEDTHGKSVFKRLYSRVEQKYPFTEYYMFNLNHVVDSYRELEALEVLDTATAKVVLVPKDSRGPRLISCEPLEIQWIQQGLARKIVARLEQHPLTKGHVNFVDQTINRKLALSGSMYEFWGQEQPWKSAAAYCESMSAGDLLVHETLINRPPVPEGVPYEDWVTLDMKEASDRVSLDLVKEVFGLCPNLLDALMATRSQATKLPNGQVVTLKKFAPMGSALCFPVESYLFYVLSVCTLIYVDTLDGYERSDIDPTEIFDKGMVNSRLYNSNMMRIMWDEWSKRVYVYGDDIIMRRADYATVLRYLPRYGLLFNAGKCCTAGSFRESCGCDAYRGIDVTPTRLRAEWSSFRQYDPETLYSYAALSNALYMKGYFRAVNYIRTKLVALYGLIPYTNSKLDAERLVETLDALPGAPLAGCSGVCFYTEEATAWKLNRGIKVRFSPQHTTQYKSWCAVSREEKTPHDGYPEYLRRHNLKRDLVAGSPMDLYAVRHRSRLQMTWNSMG